MAVSEIPSINIVDANIRKALINYLTKKDFDDAMKSKQDALTTSQTDAVNSGITNELVDKLNGIENGAQKNPDLSGYAKKSDIPSLDGYAKTKDVESAKSELQTEIDAKADKVPEWYGKWIIADDPTKGSIYVKDGMTLGIDWNIDRYTTLFIYPVIRCPYAEQFFPSLISAPYHMRFRYVHATQATSANSIRMVLPFMLVSLIDEDTGVKTYGDGNSSFSIDFSSADDNNTPREFEITRYDYIGQTPVCVVRMRKI